MTDTSTIEIQLEGHPHHVPDGTTLAALVASLGHEQTRVTTAVNGSFLPRSYRDARQLQAGDVVLLFQAIVGG